MFIEKPVLIVSAFEIRNHGSQVGFLRVTYGKTRGIKELRPQTPGTTVPGKQQRQVKKSRAANLGVCEKVQVRELTSAKAKGENTELPKYHRITRERIHTDAAEISKHRFTNAIYVEAGTTDKKTSTREASSEQVTGKKNIDETQRNKRGPPKTITAWVEKVQPKTDSNRAVSPDSNKKDGSLGRVGIETMEGPAHVTMMDREVEEERNRTDEEEEGKVRAVTVNANSKRESGETGELTEEEGNPEDDEENRQGSMRKYSIRQFSHVEFLSPATEAVSTTTQPSKNRVLHSELPCIDDRSTNDTEGAENSAWNFTGGLPRVT